MALDAWVGARPPSALEGRLLSACGRRMLLPVLLRRGDHGTLVDHLGELTVQVLVDLRALAQDRWHNLLVVVGLRNLRRAVSDHAGAILASLAAVAALKISSNLPKQAPNKTEAGLILGPDFEITLAHQLPPRNQEKFSGATIGLL